MKLTKAEEQLMEIIWEKRKAFMKDIIDAYPEPKPAATTIATLLKRMQNKGVIAYKQYGNSRRYEPLIRKRDYFSQHVGEIVKDFFGNSALQFASFFTRSANLTADELEDLKKIVEHEIRRKKK
jgi:predicted transcriptional regulator